MPQRVVDAGALWGYYTAMNENEIKNEQGQEDIPADEASKSPDEAAPQQAPAPARACFLRIFRHILELLVSYCAKWEISFSPPARICYSGDNLSATT